MTTRKIQEERVRNLNDEETRDGDYVLYWMQSSQRAEHNHALEYAVQQANDLGRRLLVVFGLTDDYPEANLRHYTFMLEGLKNVEEALKALGIKFIVRRGSPDEVALEAGEDASLIVTDRGYLRPQREWRRRVAERTDCRVTQVESDVVVPVELASGKQEHAARTLRPRIGEHLEDFLVGLNLTKPEKESLNMKAKGLDLSDVGKVLDDMDLDRSVGVLSHLYRGGTSEAKKMFRRFLKDGFGSYDEHRNQPQTDDVSHMS
ncbi:MAG: deoxyribodipyrimidine photo-lyase, partial [Rubrobacter sp.]